MTQAKYTTRSTQQVAGFLDSVDALNGDSVAVLDAIKNDAEMKVPASLSAVLGKVGSGRDEGRILDSVTRGIDEYTKEHGVAPTADVVEAALQQGHSAIIGIDAQGHLLDGVSNSASSNHHEQMSLQSNRAVVAILSAIAEAIPFAGYLPVDIGSNQSKLAILSHLAGSTYGSYTSGGIMDGVSIGDVYTSSSRMVKFDVTGAAPFNSKFTSTNLATTGNTSFCDPAGTGIPVLRGRTIVYVNGKIAANDTASGSAANSTISGSVSLDGTSYALVGYITISTGAVQITSSTPSLPNTAKVTAQSFVDYEQAPALIPSVIVKADTYDLYANPWRVMTSVSIDSSGQLRNELGLDASSEALMAIRTQMAMERHYLALRMVADLGINNQETFDFDWVTRRAQMNRAQIWQDLQAKFTKVDQKMANDTMDHGITHCYVGSWLAGIMQSLPSTMFESSGIAARPGIYRVGRLFGKYEVYYSPKVATQASDLTSAQIICTGRSSQVARNPVILGDAIAPTFLDLNMQSDLKRSAAMYARDYTSVNPHEPSALGCALINVTNLG